jgi:chemotaxis family two-component system sensor kinase Cph1
MADLITSLEPGDPVDLTNCDREPIHIPGSIQPHATLLVLREPELTVLQASANAPESLGLSLNQLLGSPLGRWLGAADLEHLQTCLRENSLEATPHLLPPLRVGLSKVAFEATVHRLKGGVILELENWPTREAVLDHQLLSALKKMLTLSGAAETVAEFCQRAAEEVRKFIGFDRVMVYRFDADLSGHIISEDKRADLESYLGLHYPASDIPRQARELFRLSKLRLIPNLAYAPVPLVGSPGLAVASEPLDMSFCVTRSVSPIHVEYLQNMGVKASMSISVVIDDQLWGLFSCHHYSPRYVSHAGRNACDFLAQALTVLVAGREQAEDFIYTKLLHENQRVLDHALETESDFGEALRGMDGTSIGGIAAVGAAFVTNGTVCLKGDTPGETAVKELAIFFADNVHAEVWSTDRLAEALPAAAAIATGVSGLLAARLSREHADYLFWFREEVLQTVRWAGDITKTVTAGPLGDRLTPRKSFALWQQEVVGRSRPWQNNELAAAHAVRHSYHELYSGQTEALVRLNAEVAQARDEAVKATLVKDDFLAKLSHELRTPLNPALLISSDEAENPALPEAVRKSFAEIRDNIELQARLIDDLLDLSRISHGKFALDRRPLKLHAALSQAITIMESEFASKRVVLITKLTATEAIVDADIVRLLQVFWNVLKNAVKFTPMLGSVTVESRSDPERQLAIVRISDTGIGIKPEDLSKIFAAFSQGEHAEKDSGQRFGGLGLGLAITRSLLDAQGGRISVESAGINQGSTFTIELPLLMPTKEPVAVPAVAPPIAKAKLIESRGPVERRPHSKKILLVEDHASTRSGMTLILERRGYRVHAAATIKEGLDLAMVHDFALVISDIGLPDGDGYTLMRQVREIRPAVKAIAISGYGTLVDRQRANEAGFAELLVKPANIQALEQAIARVGISPFGSVA